MPLPDQNQPISRLPMREEVYSKILNWIMKGVFLPGEKLVDKNLAAPHLTRTDFTQMEKANAELASALAKGDPVASTKADEHFHEIMIKKSENHHLLKILKDLKIMYRRLEILFFEDNTYGSHSVEEHEAILFALKEKNHD